MKKMLALCLFMLSTLAAAQTVTVVVVTPQRPVDCALENHKLVNWVYKLKTISESPNEAVVQFVTQYGSCVNGRTAPKAVDISRATATALQNGFVWPWQKEGVSSELTAISETEVMVTLTLDKVTLFKKRPENHLSFYYQPGEEFAAQIYRDRNGQMQVYRPRVQFPWNIDLYLDGEEETEQTIRISIR